jgi:GT2 family glycosyltransferase
MAPSGGLRVCIAIATLGRADVLREVAPFLLSQSRPADVILVSAVSESDVEGLASIAPSIEVVLGPKGSSVQRNTAMRALAGRCDVVVFFDDDLIPSRYFLERIEALMLADPGLVGVTGDLVADGVTVGGLRLEDAVRAVERADQALPPLDAPCWPVSVLYGCNMAARMPQALEVGFDERLPLYAWQEDADFSIRLGALGRVMRSKALTGAHLGTTRARSPGIRLGYSQVANPYYIYKKGVFRPLHALNLVARNVIANSIRVFWPEPWVDRRGRLRGNFLAVRDLIRGRLSPERVLDL